MTFLFTDIEGSTHRWESDADAMRVDLAAHDSVLRSAIESHGGFLFKHTGDGACAAFASPRSAVDAAIDAQRRLMLPVRMGLATGEAELRDGDYFGTALNRASRVMTAGHGGQVLLADSTAALLSGVALTDLGQHRLRDVTQPVALYQLCAPGLRTDFPRPRTLEFRSGNLRAAPTSLIGRAGELADIVSAVRAHRLVTLTGVGGIGKTRLAVEVAASVADEYPDGVWLFELAAVTDPASVPDAVAAVLGVTQQPGKTVCESVATALDGRERLLVFDNCEHVVDAAADLVAAILHQSATVRVLATSREGLGLPDEKPWRVQSLDVNAAVELFAERAESISPDELPAVQDVCRRLDGIPLAIELAASRMSSMSVGEVRDRLDHRFQLLVGSRRGVERHQTLRHAVAWSFGLLDEREKKLLELCSVFAGGFDLQSACAVGGVGEDEYATLDLLDALVRKSLLVVAKSSTARTRYSMLETIRQYAEDELVARGLAGEARRAHGRYFASREAELLDLWDSPRQRDAYAWIIDELANLRTAFRWAADDGDLDTAAAIVTVTGFLGLWMEVYEPAAWAEEIIDVAKSANHSRLGELYLVATTCQLVGRTGDGIRYAEASHSVLPADLDDVVSSLIPLQDSVYLGIGRPDLWAGLCRARLTASSDTRAFARAGLVMALMAMDEHAEAIAMADGLIEAAEAADNPAALSFALLSYGTALRDAEPEISLAAARRGLRIAKDNQIRANESVLAMALCKYEADSGDPLAALDGATVAIRNYHDSGTASVIGVPLANLAYLLDRLGRYEPAATILGYAHTPMAEVTIPGLDGTIAHLRSVLGDTTYEELARKGEAMTMATITGFAYEQIDQARAQLEQAR
ncbi:ATP-binding protein [Mycolicibacterium arseniciresistens]|uniref:Adenylate/guanylate cyclase domain-containing protein n=1 Tax=Mycolicibacterium arseniciresistens TaxID=3062257 RepID=A0ABT8UMI6_9MYCO|nr:adenylate/guanylate cyclase domain-containing protein [Mycolicibacterium arseniciresistens]MDO3638351.1 adenylate/guanylate cyclase domain-containing protein [Mycolicibacterium arseniciresistens]